MSLHHGAALCGCSGQIAYGLINGAFARLQVNEIAKLRRIARSAFCSPALKAAQQLYSAEYLPKYGDALRRDKIVHALFQISALFAQSGPGRERCGVVVRKCAERFVRFTPLFAR